ncbi:holliday junction resolvase [Arthrobacter phage Emotion]|uniref:Holliday junction resolvase n=1 Tax=Arthrobacter phage Emotion TaxID=3038361 RepID=A0AA49ET25_9CAUD|nr:holliday junction resolvase [Arthrobacter phage Emotion]
MATNKAKGTAWETSLVRSLGAFFRGASGLEPRRVAQEGFLDTGDIHGIDPFIAQAKNYKSWETAIREGLDGAEVQRVRAKRDYGVAFVKRARRSTGDGYAVMTVATWARLLLRLRRAEDLLGQADPALLAYHREATGLDNDAAFPKGL